MPFIRIDKIKFDSGAGSEEYLGDSHILRIRIEYQVPSFNLAAAIVLQGEDVN